ncbi:hypothetical protein PsorP6_002846 [Peronosclerospora sorghi]|uniref:Uncharacterized protein n=1 Tax=Peronosclerospora sorghi TaxID=230839 RepID=A0ACC0VL49_9STRA|nr:hypothetical protein PsorP6_002846 [Peronosclerospora sorghi]
MRSPLIVFLALIALVSRFSSALEANGNKSKAFRNLDKVLSFSDHQNQSFPSSSTLTVDIKTPHHEERALPSQNTVETIALNLKRLAEPVRDPALGRKEALSFIAEPEKIEALTNAIWFRKLSPIEILTTRYGDDIMAQVLVTARNSDPMLTRQTAVKLSIQQLEYWKTRQKSEADVFELLELNGPERELAISDGRIAVLHSYIRMKRRAGSSDAVLIQTLLHGYGGDDKFSLLVGSAVQDSDYFTWRAGLELEKSI